MEGSRHTGLAHFSVLLALFLLGCTSMDKSSGTGLQPQAPGFVPVGADPTFENSQVSPPGPLPAFPGVAGSDLSAVRVTSQGDFVINGMSYTNEFGGNNRHDEGNQNSYTIIPGGEDELAWAQYALGNMIDDKPLDFSLDVSPTTIFPGGEDELPLSYWIGFSNYTTYSWEWHGPYTSANSITMNSATIRDRYVDSAGTFHFLIVTDASAAEPVPVTNPEGLTGLQINSSTTVASDVYVTNRPHYTPINALMTIGEKSASAMEEWQKVRVTWKHVNSLSAADEPNVAKLYQIFRQGSGDTEPLHIGTVLSPQNIYIDPDHNQLRDPPTPDPVPGETYTYLLRAENDAGYTPLSRPEKIEVPMVSEGYFETEHNDESFEANDLPVFPFSVTGSLGTDATYTGYDGDYYDFLMFTATEAGTYEITCTFDSATIDIDLAIFELDSWDFMSGSYNSGNLEQVGLYLEPSVYVVMCHASDEVGYTDYTLDGRFIPGTPGSYYETEPNDWVSEPNFLPAFPFPDPVLNGHVGYGPGDTPYDGDSNDYFAFGVIEAGFIDLTMQFNDATGELAMELLDPITELPLAESYGEGPSHRLTMFLVPGNYVLNCTAWTGYSEYQVQGSFTAGEGDVVTASWLMQAEFEDYELYGLTLNREGTTGYLSGYDTVNGLEMLLRFDKTIGGITGTQESPSMIMGLSFVYHPAFQVDKLFGGNYFADIVYEFDDGMVQLDEHNYSTFGLWGISGLANWAAPVGPDGSLFWGLVANSGAVYLFHDDGTAGWAYVSSDQPGVDLSNGVAVAVFSDGTMMLFAGTMNDGALMYSIDPDTQLISQVGNLSTGTVYGIDYMDDRVYLAKRQMGVIEQWKYNTVSTELELQYSWVGEKDGEYMLNPWDVAVDTAHTVFVITETWPPKLWNLGTMPVD